MFGRVFSVFSIVATGAILGFGITAQAQAPWPFPEDIPQPQSATPGPAGQGNPDVLRYLLARGVSNPATSPDGETVAFTSSVTGVPQLWVVPAKGGWPRQLTFGGGVTGYDWMPDGSGLIYTGDTNGDEREGMTLISLDGSTETTILEPGDAFIHYGDTSTDGSQVVYSTTARNGVDFDVRVITIETGEDKLLLEGSYGFYPQAWQPNGPWIIVTETIGADAARVRLVNAETNEVETILDPRVTSDYTDFSWRPDGSAFFLATNQGREFKGLGIYNMDRRELAMMAAEEADAGNVTVGSNGAYVAWTTNVGGYSRLNVMDTSLNALLQTPQFPEGVYDLDMAKNAPILTVHVNGPKLPGDIFTYNLETNEVGYVARSNMAGLDNSQLVLPDPVTFTARDGVALQGLLYTPTTAAEGQKLPVLVRVHGGPTSQARPTFRPVEQYLLTRGVAIFDFNFRGSTGFGKSFTRLDDREKRTDAVRDVEDLLNWLQNHETLDGARVGIIGGSYGGYLVNAAIGEYPDRFEAAVSLVGISDWVRALEEASPGLKAGDRIEYGDISEPSVRDYHARISPANNYDKITVPLMVIHGANDPRDPVTESDQLVRTVRENGAVVEYLRFPDEGHGIRKLKNRVYAYKRIADFLEAHLVTK